MIDRWSTVVYLQSGEEQKVAIRLRGLSEGQYQGGRVLTTAVAE